MFSDQTVANAVSSAAKVVCRPIVDGQTERTGAAVRERTRQRIKRGRANPAAEVLGEIVPMLTAVEAGSTFELPSNYRESAGTV